ncbi:hypothetical protein HD554DRAFT_2022465 [Boletus coccyginus]|nr:hypothetical protein HD554DRAFT_2022465 [Boletus coccyginus]
MPTPHTPTIHKSNLSLPPDTFPLPRHTSSSDYRTGNLTLGRLAVLADLKRCLQVPFLTLLRCLGTLPSSQKLHDLRHHLIHDARLLSEDGPRLRWSHFAPSSKSSASEEISFRPLASIASDILAQVPNSRLSYLANPNQTPISQRNNTSRPDAYLVLAHKADAPRVHWFDVAVPFEFKKFRDPDAVRDDEHKIIWSLHTIMREDPCRRFAFGITIEASHLRLWLSNRAFLAVTEPTDCFQNVDDLISLFYALGSASVSPAINGLGWDPTVQRIPVPHPDKFCYRFAVGDELFTTTGELATFGADSMVGRGTRVYTAHDSQGKKVALKDSWRDVSRPSEGDILANILASCRSKLPPHQVADAERHFLCPRLCSDVAIDGAPDETMLGGDPDPTWKWVQIDPNPVLSERCHLPSAGHIPDSGKSSVISHVPLRTVPRHDPGVPRRVHTRTVFDDVGTALKDTTSLPDSLACLSDGLKALYYLHKAGWVHRDFSVGNVIWVLDESGNLVGKLGDFEYAKEVDSSVSHDVRTGTMHFMAVEVESQRYLFRPQHLPPKGTNHVPNPIPSFRMNFLHDVESVWWALVWVFFYHTDAVTAMAGSSPSFDADGQWNQFQLAFPGALNQSTREHFFTQPHDLSETCNTVLSPTCRVVSECIPHFAKTLLDGYQKAEAQRSSLVLDDSLLEHVHQEAAAHLNDAQPLARGIDLRPLPDLLKHKRPRPESPPSPLAGHLGKKARHD